LKGRIGDTYLVGSGVEATIEEMADLVLAAAGKPATLKEIVKDRPGHDTRYLLDSAKLRTELGWAPEIPLRSGVAGTVAWFGANRSWWEPLLEKASVDEHAWANGGTGRVAR
jgi:dTDP-glucose 4,6-dehydratase